MELARRFRWIALSAPVVLAAASAIGRPWPPGALAGGAAAHGCGPEAPAIPAAAPAWYRLDSVLDESGTLAQQQLTVGRGSATWSAALPPESFASGPVGGRVLVGEDDGRRSQLRVLDTATGCWTVLGAERDVVRSALIAPDGETAYEHRVDRGTRRDLGVWRRSLGSRAGAQVQVLPGLDAEDGYGPTFTTTLLASSDGRLLASACGEHACRNRVVDPASGAVVAVDQTGPAVGLIGGRLVALEACGGFPCPLVAVDLDGGGRRAQIAEARGPASVTAGPDGLVVLAGPDGLGVASAARGVGLHVVPGSRGLAPLASGSTATSGLEAPDGRVAVAPLGPDLDPSAVSILDPATLLLIPGEVLP